MSPNGAGRVRVTIGGVAGAFLRVPVSGDGPGGEVRKVYLVGPWGWLLVSTHGHAGVTVVPRIGAPCRRTVPEELLGQSVESLVLSCVCRCPEMAPDIEDYMVTRVGRLVLQDTAG